jgi:hypothetical protein
LRAMADRNRTERFNAATAQRKYHHEITLTDIIQS